MLTDQTFSRPIRIALGYEFFYQATIGVTQLNLSRIARFKYGVVNNGPGYSFSFIDTSKRPHPVLKNPYGFETSLQHLGIPFQGGLFHFDQDDPVQLKELNEYVNLMDLVYAPSLTAKNIVNTAPVIVADADIFLDALDIWRSTLSPFEQSAFKKTLESLEVG
jgi:hypothetical protein